MNEAVTFTVSNCLPRLLNFATGYRVSERLADSRTSLSTPNLLSNGPTVDLLPKFKCSEVFSDELKTHARAYMSSHIPKFRA